MTSQPAAHPPASEAGRVIPERKLPGDEGRIVPSPRMGSNPPAQEHEPKAAQPDLRQRICENGPCKETPVQPPAESELRRRICANGPCKEAPTPPPAPNPDLRRRICKDGPCVECPPGQSGGKNGTCVGTPAPIVSDQCQPNQTWNGAACVPSTQCPPGSYWNGVACANTTQCAAFSSRAAMLANELRGIKAQMQTACSSNPLGQECSSLKQSYDGALLRYRMLMNEAPVDCRPMLPDPLSL